MFVGSSSESKDLIRDLGASLKGEGVEIRGWATSRWSLSEGTLGNLEGKLEEADFAAFILSADDVAIIRGEEVEVARDNVIFELGLAFGLLGRKRTFILAPRGSLHTPTDLAGITVAQYEVDPDIENSMNDPGTELLREIKAQGRRERPAPHALMRGDATRIDTVADAALHVFDSRDTYVAKLREAVLEGEKVPPKFQFAAADGGRHWLRLCRSKNYRYFERSKAHLRLNATKLAEAVHEAAGGTSSVDFVSLGCGNGTKDELVLQALIANLTRREYVYYYPIDISDILLVEAVRYVSQHVKDHSRLRCKAVLGDFTHLSAFSAITAYRTNTKLFSALGNVIGSFDEEEILKSISGAMAPGDLVLLDANIGEPDDSRAMLEDDAASQWDLSTLDALDIDRESLELDQELVEGESMVPGTNTLISYAVPREDETKKYLLSALHHYNFEELKVSIEKELGIELIERIAGEKDCKGVCLLLGQRSR
jgi:Predicted nucleotide-binding protein containing TIR-like domain/Histidine-specific methyltransferase, SAM-dependent